MGFGVDLMSFSALVTETLPRRKLVSPGNMRKAAPESLIDRLVNRFGAAPCAASFRAQVISPNWRKARAVP